MSQGRALDADVTSCLKRQTNKQTKKHDMLGEAQKDNRTVRHVVSNMTAAVDCKMFTCLDLCLLFI